MKFNKCVSQPESHERYTLEDFVYDLDVRVNCMADALESVTRGDEAGFDAFIHHYKEYLNEADALDTAMRMSCLLKSRKKKQLIALQQAALGIYEEAKRHKQFFFQLNNLSTEL